MTYLLLERTRTLDAVLVPSDQREQKARLSYARPLAVQSTQQEKLGHVEKRLFCGLVLSDRPERGVLSELVLLRAIHVRRYRLLGQTRIVSFYAQISRFCVICVPENG